MYYKRIMMLDGPYVDAAGQRWDVCAAFRVRDAKGVNVGYEEFPSLEDALEAWGLRFCIDEHPASTSGREKGGSLAPNQF